MGRAGDAIRNPGNPAFPQETLQCFHPGACGQTIENPRELRSLFPAVQGFPVLLVKCFHRHLPPQGEPLGNGERLAWTAVQRAVVGQVQIWRAAQPGSGTAQTSYAGEQGRHEKDGKNFHGQFHVLIVGDFGSAVAGGKTCFPDISVFPETC